MGALYAHCPVEGVLAVDADLGKSSRQRMTCCRGGSQSHAHHTNMPTAGTSAEPTAAAGWIGVAAVVTDSTAAVAAGKAQSDRMLTTKQGTQEPAVSDLGTRSHHLSHGDHQMGQ